MENMQHGVNPDLNLGDIELTEDEYGFQFHTHWENGIQICDRFLLGLCQKGNQCQLHHTRYPYHWQIMYSKRGVWESICESAQRHLEMLYCDVLNSEIKVFERDGSKGKVRFQYMAMYPFGPYCKIRRLSNSHDPQQNFALYTMWRVFYYQGSQWNEYPMAISSEIIKACDKALPNYSFTWEGKLHSIDLNNFILTNVETQEVYPIQARPVYRTLTQMVPFLKTLPNGPRGSLDPYMAPILGEDPTDGYCGPYPAAWVPITPGRVSYVQHTVAASEYAYLRVCCLFHSSLSQDLYVILGIYRIRQDYLWEKYNRQKELMSQGLIAEEKQHLEKYLFHGTAPKNTTPICQKGFDSRLSDQHLAVLGKGTYFAPKASYAHGFSPALKGGLRHMFLTKVLVGKSTKGKSSYCQPPARFPGGPSYDSCTDSSKSRYVIFNNSQSYPYFLIHYKNIPDPVQLQKA